MTSRSSSAHDEVELEPVELFLVSLEADRRLPGAELDLIVEDRNPERRESLVELSDPFQKSVLRKLESDPAVFLMVEARLQGSFGEAV